MNIPKGSRHFATYNRHSVMILGFHASTNTVYVVNLEQLPYDEASELINIACSAASQKVDTLATILAETTHTKSNTPWLSVIWANKGNRWVGSTFPDNLADMNQDQKNFFKGFGRTLNESEPAPEETSHVFRSAANQELAPTSVPQAVKAPEAVPAALIVDDEEDMVSTPQVPLVQTSNQGQSDEIQFLRRQIDNLVATVTSQQNEIARLSKKVPGKAGRPKGAPNKPKIVTGRPTPTEVFPQVAVSG